jgi:hypothetical protein
MPAVQVTPQGLGNSDGEVLDFGWDDDRELTGRRKAALKKTQKARKPGTFGACLLVAGL